MDDNSDNNAQDDLIEPIPKKKRKSRTQHDDFSKYFDTVTEMVNGEKKKFFICKLMKNDKVCGARYTGPANSSAV
jgi:hypothetical protein